MNTTLASDQISHYREDGFTIQRGFLSLEELETWRRVIDDAVLVRGERKLAAAPGNNVMKDSEDNYYHSRVFCQRINLWQRTVCLADRIFCSIELFKS